MLRWVINKKHHSDILSERKALKAITVRDRVTQSIIITGPMRTCTAGVP